MSETLVIKACKCMVKKDDGQVYIDYCPKHKAAPDMYEALEAITGAFNGGLEWMGPDTLTAMEMGKAALAKARGE